jgi:HK97 family phage portal protein
MAYEFKIGGKSIFSFGRSVENANIPLTGTKILEIFGGTPTESGVSVNESTAMTLSSVYCAVRVITESIAQLPLQIFQKTENGRELLSEHPLYYKLHDQPNNFQTAFTFRETVATRQCLAGNGYAYISRDSLGNVLELIPFPVDMDIVPKYDSKRSTIFYVVNGRDIIEQANILHMPALSMDGIEGKSPVTLAKESFGLGIVQERFASRFFGKGANPDVILEHPAKLGAQAIDNIKKSWTKDSGASNSFLPKVLEEGMKFTKLSIAPEEAQFLESRKFSKTEIATWFRLPPHMINDLSQSTFSNIEQQDIGFVKYSLAPWLKRWEQEHNRKLLTEQEKKDGVFIEFNLDGLLRGDTATRGEFYTKMIAARVFSPNEVRRMENRSDYEGGDKYENPNTTSPNAPKEAAPTKKTRNTKK